MNVIFFYFLSTSSLRFYRVLVFHRLKISFFPSHSPFHSPLFLLPSPFFFPFLPLIYCPSQLLFFYMRGRLHQSGFGHCDKITEKNNLKEGKVDSDSQFQFMVRSPLSLDLRQSRASRQWERERGVQAI